MKTNFKKILASAGVIAGVVTPVSLGIQSILSNQTTKNVIDNDIVDQSFETETFASARTFSTDNASIQTISSNLGPIVIDNTNPTKVINYDWYYNPAWQVDVSTTEFGNSTGIADWEYLPDKDFLFLVTDKSVLIKLRASTGEVLASLDQASSGIPVSSNKITTIDFNSTLYVWNSKSPNSSIASIDANTLKATNASVGSQKNSVIELLGLDVGYNLAITTTDTIANNSSTITNIKLQFVDDGINNFTPPSGHTIPSIDLTITGTAYNNIYKNVFKRSSSSYVLAVANKLYQINLNRQDMSQSTITEITPSSGITLKAFNSGYMSANGSIFLKSNSDANIYRMAPSSNTVAVFSNLASVPNSTNPELNTAANAADNALRIYPVPNSPSVNSGTYLDNVIFVIDPKTSLSTGLNNGNFLYNFQTTKPDVIVPDASKATFLNKIPSAISSNDFISQNADTLLSTNVTLEADDLAGTLKATFRVTKTAWYSTSSKTNSIIHHDFNVSKIYSTTPSDSKFNFATQSAFNNIASGYFTKKSPSQITSADFDLYGSSVLPLSSSVNISFLKDLKRVFIITGRVDSTGEIKVKAIVSYTNVYGNYVSFVVNEQTYTVTKTSSSSYEFLFTSNDSSTLTTMKQTLPSLIDNTDVPLMEKFISKEVLYPPSRRNIFLQPNDVDGTVTVVVTYNGLDPTVAAKFEQVFSGFVTEAEATVKFNGSGVDATTRPDLASVFPLSKDITSISGYAGYGNRIVNEIKISDLTLTYDFSILARMGFVPTISILPATSTELEYGALTVQVSFDPATSTSGKKLPSIYKDKFGLKDYKITQQYVGFLSVGVLYTISLKSYDSTPVQKLVSSVPVGSVVEKTMLLDTLNLKGFTMNEVILTNYTWKNEALVFEVIAQSTEYSTINKKASFTVDWAPFFQSSRTRNLIIGVVVALLGAILVASAIAFYIFRKNKIRRMLK